MPPLQKEQEEPSNGHSRRVQANSPEGRDNLTLATPRTQNAEYRKQHTQKMSWLSEEENRENRQVAYRVPGAAPITSAVQDLGLTAKSFHDGWTR